MEKKEYDQLFLEGYGVFVKICAELNKISDQHIRKDPYNNYRREEDYKEICIALALSMRNQNDT